MAAAQRGTKGVHLGTQNTFKDGMIKLQYSCMKSYYAPKSDCFSRDVYFSIEEML